jgi:hypothetical protein
MHCLGLGFLGGCSYDPSSPTWRIITLGDTIAAISLLIAFSQLLTPVLKIRISGLFPRIYILWGFAALSVLFASILPFIPGKAWPLLGFPIFWELLGGILILVGIIAVIFRFSRPLKFSKGTYNYIIRVVMRGIATGEDKDHAELAHSLQKIIKGLVFYATRYDSVIAEFESREGRAYVMPELSAEAGHVLRLCSDEKFCSTVVRREPGFAIMFFEEVKRQRACHNNYMKPLAWELIRQSLINIDSILYREKKYKGLGFNASFTQSAFSDSDFNEWVQPLSGYNLILEKQVPVETLERLGDVLGVIAKTYLDSERYYEHSFSIYSSFRELTDYAGFISHRIDSSTPENVYQSDVYRSLGSISNTLCEVVQLFASDSRLAEEKLVAHWKGVERNRDNSPFEYVSKWIYDYIAALAHTRKYDQELRSALITLWMEIYHHSSQTEVFHREVLTCPDKTGPG